MPSQRLAAVKQPSENPALASHDSIGYEACRRHLQL